MPILTGYYSAKEAAETLGLSLTGIRDALDRMSHRGWTRLASGAGSRALKYRHLLDEALSLSEPELSLLAVLMLRGPQTPGELKQRSERLYRADSTVTVTDTEPPVFTLCPTNLILTGNTDRCSPLRRSVKR